jgi:hypothetical protein
MSIHLTNPVEAQETNESIEPREMKTSITIVKHEWDFPTWFVFMRPVLGVLFGFLSLLVFVR